MEANTCEGEVTSRRDVEETSKNRCKTQETDVGGKERKFEAEEYKSRSAKIGRGRLKTTAEISHSFLGTYRRTCGLARVDVVKIFGNGVKIVWNRQNREGGM